MTVLHTRRGTILTRALIHKKISYIHKKSNTHSLLINQCRFFLPPHLNINISYL